MVDSNKVFSYVYKVVVFFSNLLVFCGIHFFFFLCWTDDCQKSGRLSNFFFLSSHDKTLLSTPPPLFSIVVQLLRCVKEKQKTSTKVIQPLYLG